MPKVTQQAFADHIGVSRVAISELQRRGVVDLTQGLEHARLAYCSHLRQVAAGHLSEDGELDITAERARLAMHQADKQEMDNQVRRGELLEADVVVGQVGRLIDDAKAALLALPTSIAAEVRATATQAEAQALLKGAIHQALHGLAQSVTDTLDPST